MSGKPARPKSDRIRHRIKEIELQPIRSKYPINVKLLVDGQEVCELLRIKRDKDLKWSRPIVCRNVRPESKVTLEICEIHKLIDKSFKSEAYTVSDVQDRTETTIGFPDTQWTAKLTLLTPATVGETHDDALQQLKETQLAPSAVERLGKARMVFENILEFGGAVAEAHPTAKLVFSICAVAWKKLKEEEQLKEDTQELVDGLIGIVDLAKMVKKHTDMEQLKDTTEAALILLEDIFIYVLEHESKSNSIARAARRFVDSSDQDRVKGLLARFEELRAKFGIEVAVETHKRQYQQELRQLLEQLQPVDSADYNSKPACQDGTRVQIIGEVMGWTEQHPDTTSKSKRLLWIHGQAGIGKSSIASSVCRKLKQMNALAASFFCKRRGGSELQDPLRLMNTIAHGLASRCPEYGEAVAVRIKDDGKLCKTSPIHERYEGLFDKPLKEVKDLLVHRPLIVLVDAVDECGTRESCEELLRCLHLLSGCVSWLKVVITSRPDGDIKEFFTRLGDEHFSSRNVHDFDASDDIRAYFQKELDKVAVRWEWPEGSVDRLCEKAGGLFIWASTARLHIGSPIGRDVAVQRFNVVLEGKKSAVSELDVLYDKVIEDAMRDTRDDNREVFCRYIGAIVVTSTRRPLSLTDLSSVLLGYLDRDTLEHVVESLRAVLQVDEQMGGALRFYHQSFVDYAVDRSRSDRFYVDPEERNAELARGCLNTMELELKFNICGLETSDVFNSQVPDFAERVQSKISGQLSYSCAYWISHLTSMSNGVFEHMLDALLGGPRVLYWIEALSLLGGLDAGMTGLLELLDWLPHEWAQTRGCVIDMYRFISAFYDAISTSTPHLYVSALALAPESALVVRRLKSLFPNTVSVTNGRDKNWPDWLRTLIHPDKVCSLAISPDGRRLVTGCADSSIRLWDMRTGAQIGEPLVGHSNYVGSVAFSPNSNYIVSGSNDHTLRLWDAKSRAPIGEPLLGHSGKVFSATFSPQGDLIASGSFDHTLRIWDAKACTAIGEPLTGHSSCVSSVAFSPNGRLIVSASYDKTLRLWDAQSRTPIGQPLVGHSSTFHSVAFSPCGDIIASGSGDKTVRTWDVKTRSEIGEPLVGHSEPVRGVAFSPKGDLLISVSHDKTVRMWDVKNRAAFGEPLLGHSGWVTSVAFSSKDELIVSGSFDKTVRMWHANTRAPISERELLAGHSNVVTSVAFSPTGDLFASGGSDKTARMWDVKTGAVVGDPLVGHLNSVTAVAFSPNGNLIASGSGDHTVRMWDARTCAAIGEPLVGHSDTVTSVAFSPNSDFVVSGAYDKTLRMWDANARTHVAIGEPLVGHSDWVLSVAFSPHGNLIASGSTDRTVRIWDTDTCAPVGEPLVGHSEKVTAVAFSPDGDLIVSGSVDNTVRIWDSKTCASIGEPLVGHPHWVSSVAFFPNGNLIVSGCWDRRVRFWDVKTCTQIGKPLTGHLEAVTTLALSPNGDLLVTGSSDHTVRVWVTEPQASDPSAQSRNPWPLTTFGLPPLPQHHGWVSLDGSSILLWLPIRYRRPYDPRALYSISADPALSTISLDFSKFVHGNFWTSIASNEL